MVLFLIHKKGPQSDVSGNGYYIYLETSGVIKGDAARIISPLFNATMAKSTRNKALLLNLIKIQTEM